MKIGMTALVVVVMMMTVASDQAQTAPRPSVIPSDWEVDIKYDRPYPIKVYLVGQAKPKLFWYLRYTLINRGRQDIDISPKLDLYTETGQTLRAWRNVPREVYNAVKKHHNDPLLRDDQGSGKLLRGADNAKSCVALWPDFDPKAGSFDIFVGGLSGEKAEVALPKPITAMRPDATGVMKEVKVTKIILDKTLRISCTITGEAAARIRSRIRITNRTWIMR